MKKNVVLIPALNPPKELYNYAKELVSNNNIDLIVINDGSKKEYKRLFNRVAKLPNTVVLTHEVNRGKGRGLKTGFEYFVKNYKKSKVFGIVTADSDGQHLVKDILKVSKELGKIKGEGLILGTRNFNLDHVPFKSRNGNKITTTVFRLLYGKKINDTQTGLRGITYDFAKECIEIKGERFEYEINMLIKAVKEKIDIKEVEIETVYFNNNSETHFNPVKDSIKIYKVMFKEFFKFSFSGITSAVLDLALFTLFYALLKNNVDKSIVILLPTIFARAFSSLYNYTLNKNLVFKSKAKNTMIKYYILCVIQALASWLLVDNIFNSINIQFPTIVKVFVDVVLFLISYKIQQIWVFKEVKKQS